MNFKSNSSLRLREEGNQIYGSINESLSPILRETRLNKCFSLYQQSINAAETSSDLASAYKNHSVASFELLKLCLLKDHKKAIYYMKEMQNSIQNAIVNGKLCNMPNEWVYQLSAKVSNGIDEYFKVYANDEEKVMDLLLKLKENLNDNLKCYLLYKISVFYYHASLKQIEYDINLSFRSINECRFYSEECSKLSKQLDNRVSFDIEEIISDRSLQECLIDGLRYFNIAEKNLDKVINYEETLNIESIWDCIDLYHDAIVRTLDKDIELEAKIKSKLGYIYKNILKLHHIAMRYFYDSFNLAEAMKPKLFTHESWFIRATNAIKQSQGEKIDEEKKRKEKLKEKVKHKIEKDLNSIQKEARKGNKIEFLKFVHNNYKGKHSTKTKKVVNLEKLSSSELKKVIKADLIIYHPDKNADDEDMNSGWYFITEEITKHLSAIYEQLK